MLRELRLEGGGLASAQDADTDGVEGPDVHVGAGRRGSRRAARSRGRTVAASSGASSSPELRDRLLQIAGAAAAAVPRRQGARLVERPRARGARGGRLPARAGGLARGGTRSRRVPARLALGARRRSAPVMARRADERAGYPRRLRERRVRADGAARRDRRAALAGGGAPARAARGRAASPTTENGGFFLSPAGRRRARRPHEGSRRQPDPVRELDARAGCCSGSRGSGATTSSSGSAVGVLRLVAPALTRAPTAFGWALCALDLYLSPPRELAIVGPVETRPVARAALAPFQPNTVVAVGPAGSRAAARGQEARRRPPGRLRLRALRLPGTRHRSRRAGGVRPCVSA